MENKPYLADGVQGSGGATGSGHSAPFMKKQRLLLKTPISPARRPLSLRACPRSPARPIRLTAAGVARASRKGQSRLCPYQHGRELPKDSGCGKKQHKDKKQPWRNAAKTAFITVTMRGLSTREKQRACRVRTATWRMRIRFAQRK